MFEQVALRRLRQMAEELGRIGDQDPKSAQEVEAIRYARCLSALMMCELTERTWKDVDP